MKTEDIHLLYEYSEWANKRILDAAEKLSQEQLRASNALGWGSILGALIHILDAEYGWRRFLNDEEGPGFIEEEDCPDIVTLRGRWERENQALWAFLRGLRDEDLYRVHISHWDGKDYHQILWHCLVHVVNHGTQHRSECAALLTGFGHSPGDMDFTRFLSERGIEEASGGGMGREEIKLLFAYSDWANDRILAAAEKVSQEELAAPNAFGWGSLRGALVHIMDAECAWRILLKEGVRVEEMDPQAFSDVAAIRSRWGDERRAMWEYLNGLSDEDLVGTISYDAEGSMRHRALWHCLAHVVNHGTQHRSECAALLTGIGHSPGDMDFTLFLGERATP